MTTLTPLRRRKITGYGWIPDLPDARDHLYAVPARVLTTLPEKIDLRNQCPPVYNQGHIGSCTANAIAGAFEFGLRKQGLTDFMPSRLFVYFNERNVEGTVATDAGAMIRDGVQSVVTLGVCSETDWPYDDTAPTSDGGTWPAEARAGQRPADACYTAAKENTATSYQRVNRTLPQLKGCLAAGYPFVFGFSVYESFESQAVARSGNVPMPRSGEQLLGGHAVLAVGYDDTISRFIVRNSWGTSWGQDGYFTLPYAFLTERNLSSDFWTIRVVT